MPGSLAIAPIVWHLVSVHISPKRKLLLSVLALAGVAIGVDRLILQGNSGPAHAAADLLPTALEAKAQTPAPGRDAKPRPGTVSDASANERVAVRLASLNRAATDADAFAPPASWLARIAPSASATTHDAQPLITATQTQAPSQPTPRPPAFRLSLVTRQAGVAVAAVINGTRVALGESIDGYRLVGLAASEPAGPGNRAGRPAIAVLEGPAGTIELPLDPQPAAAVKD